MPFFYILHSLDWGNDLPDGKRNTRIFLVGVVMYCIAFTLLANMNINGYFGKLWDSIYTSCIVIVLADIAVMGYTYKNHFGRSIINEISADEDERWNYDKDNHRYKKKLIDPAPDSSITEETPSTPEAVIVAEEN